MATNFKIGLISSSSNLTKKEINEIKITIVLIEQNLWFNVKNLAYHKIHSYFLLLILLVLWVYLLCVNVTGPGGRSLVEIQQMSGANIQISKKGIFAPGTRNRIVTITGSPTAINAATYLIEQRIQEEEMKRARNNPLVGTLTMQ